MAKRRLTQQQRLKQAQNQAARIKRSENLIESNLDSMGPEQMGLLIAHYGVHAIIESEKDTLHHCKIRQNLGSLVCGDKVVWQEASDGSGIVVARLERTSVLARPNPQAHHKTDMKVIAANIDLLVIVIAPKPALSIDSLDAYLIIAEQLQIEPLILVNKSDLLTEEASEFLSALKIYESLGYCIIYNCTIDKSPPSTAHDDTLRSVLKNRTSVLVGQSGVGKSSLIQYLIPQAEVRIGALCTIHEIGKHTTTGSRLYHLPSGGSLIDSPGIRSFGLWHLSEKELAQSFVEFRPYLGHCQFRNCHHQNQTGCAILKAMEEGHIHWRRLQSFYELINKHGSNF